MFLVNLDGVTCKINSASVITSLKSVEQKIFSGLGRMSNKGLRP